MLRRDPLANPEPLIKRVYAFVAYRIGDGADAEDVTSETFARAVHYRGSFDPARGDAIPWLIGIARRCIAEHISARVDVPSCLDDDARAEADLAGDVVRRLELARAMRTLHERDRELLALRYGADMTARQIAELLGLRVNTVEVALHRSLARLRDELARDDAVDDPSLPAIRISPASSDI